MLRDPGFGKVRVFYESWLGNGNDLSAPAEAVHFVNIGILMSRIKSLESEVDKLTTEVEVLEGAKQ